MDRQNMQPGGGGGSSAATQDWLHPGAGGGGQPAAAQVVDGTFLMELLEDAPATEQEQPQKDVDQLSRVIQSLEAEIDGARPPAYGGTRPEHVSSDFDGGILDDMLSDLDSSPGPCAAEALPPFEYWVEVPPAVGHDDLDSWYLDDDGAMLGGYEFREQCYQGNGDSLAVDQVYSPLWE